MSYNFITNDMLKAKNASILTVPKFRKGQVVCFIGGAGVIKNYRPELGVWVYLVEMSKGLEPEMGRVGYETMVWLPEGDLSLLEDNLFLDLAIA